MKILSILELFFKFKIKILFLSWVITIVVIGIFSKHLVIFSLNENQIISLYSTSSQIIGGIYGLIITSYIFFRNELDRRSTADESLETIIEYIKKDYFKFIQFISIYVLISIILSLILISYQNNSDSTFVRVLLNTCGFTIFFTFISILILILTMVDPKSIEIASDIINKELSDKKNDTQASIEDFLNYFNKIEEILNYYKKSTVFIENGKKRTTSYITNKAVLKRLVYDQNIDDRTYLRLWELIKYRNSIIHGSDFYIGNKNINEAKELLDILLKLKND